MRISFNTFRPYTQNLNNTPKQANRQSNSNINFTSGYGAEDWDIIDNPDLAINSNLDKWKNIGKAIKMMTIDQYKYSHDIYPKKPPLLYTPEEYKKFQEEFYKGTDYEGVDPATIPVDDLPPRPPSKYEDYDDYDD